MTMIIAFHGGMCCGMKTICHLGLTPHQVHEELEGDADHANRDIAGEETETWMNFYPFPAPHETGASRLKRYIEYLKKKRPQHIVEVVIAKSDSVYLDQSDWVPVLLQQGFKIVNENKNSNSGNTIVVFHLNLNETVRNAESAYENCE